MVGHKNIHIKEKERQCDASVTFRSLLLEDVAEK